MPDRESHIQRAILAHFGARDDLLLWRNHVGVGEAIDGSGRIQKFGVPGSADILGVQAPAGRAIAIEVKAARGRQSERQRTWQAAFEKVGGRYILARSVEDVEEGLDVDKDLLKACREALEPFKMWAEAVASEMPDDLDIAYASGRKNRITIGDLRRARSVLSRLDRENAGAPLETMSDLVREANRAATPAAAVDTAEKVIEAARRLSNEVRGCWEMSESSLRYGIGNTNYAIVRERLLDFAAALAAHEGRGG